MADYTLVAKLTADAKQFVAGFKEAENKMANLQGKVTGFGERFKSLGNRVSEIGSSFTNRFTKPVLIATTAVGGLTAALGWKRLVSIDTAQGQLKGLGYSAEDVERISGQLAKALEGGMMTMGEATAAAANGMAAGVKEGKELTKYIQLLDSAVVGGTGSFDEMNQIFAQTADLGHLTANNFDMMALRMPGFSSAMQEHMGVSGQAFRDMLNSGEITFDEFLNLMDDFAGDMAGAYANTWAGMVQNTLAYVGILGETLLEGVFQTSKEEIANFIEVLNSDELTSWASRTGEAIHNSFSTVIDSIRDAKSWYDNLSPSIQNVITKGALIGGAFLIGIGPALGVAGWLITAFGTISTIAGALMGPLGLVALGIAAIIAIGVQLYQNWDTLKEKGQSIFSNFGPVFDLFSSAFERAKEGISRAVDALKVAWEGLQPVATVLAQIVGGVLVAAFGVAISILNGAANAIGPLISAFANFLSFITNMIASIVSLFTGDFQGAIDHWTNAGEAAVHFFVDIFEGLITFFAGFVETIVEFFYGLYMTLVGNSIIPDMVNEIVEWFVDLFSSLIEIVTNIVDGIVGFFTTLYERAVGIFNAFSQFIVDTWTFIQQTFSNVLAFLLALVTGDFEGMKNAMQNQMQNAQQLLSNIWTLIKSLIGQKASEILSDVTSKFNEVKTNVSNKISEAKDAVFRYMGNMVSDVVSKGSEIVSSVVETFTEFKSNVESKMGEVVSLVSEKIGELPSKVLEIGSSMYEAGRNIISSVADGIKDAAGSVGDAIGGVASRVRGFLPFSPAKEGPLMDIHRLNFAGPISQSIDKAIPFIQKKMGIMMEMPDQGNPHDASLKYAVENGNQRGHVYKNRETTNHNENNIVINATIKDEEDINKLTKKLDETLSNLSDRRRAAFGG